jgi:hypothetical protein
VVQFHVTPFCYLKVGGSIPPSLNFVFGGIAQSGERQTEVFYLGEVAKWSNAFGLGPNLSGSRVRPPPSSFSLFHSPGSVVG